MAATHQAPSTKATTTDAANCPQAEEKKPALSARQRHCLYLSANGLTDEEVAGALGITMATVRFHFAKAQQRLSARNRRHTIYLATISGLLGGRISLSNNPRFARSR